MNTLQKIPNHWYVIASAWFSKIVTIAAQLLAIRLVISVLGEDKYAVFVLIMALLNWIMLTDMGIGSSLQNAISICRAKKEDPTDPINAALIILVPIVIGWILLINSSAPLISEIYFSEYTSLIKNSPLPLIETATFLFIGITLGTVINRIWYAQQVGWKANLLVSVGWLFGLPCVYLSNLVWQHKEISDTLIAFYLPQSLIGWGCFSYFLYQSLRKKHNFKKQTFIPILRKAAGFWLFFLACAIALQSDYFIMSQNIKGQEIVQYSIVSKLFSVTGFMFSAILSALWPVCAEAAAINKWDVFFHHARKYIPLGIAFIIACTGLFILLRNEIIWVLVAKGTIFLPIPMIITFGVYQILRVWCDTYCVLLLSLNRLKPILLFYSIQAILGILFQWYGSLHFGYLGLILGLALSLIMTTMWGLPYLLLSHIKKNRKSDD